jgi:predicted outer membrane lipoprotein
MTPVRGVTSKPDPAGASLGSPLREEGAPAAKLTFDAFLATGAAFGEALAMVVLAHGAQAAFPLLADWIPGEDLASAFETLDALAVTHPDLAQRGFDAWGHNRFVGGDFVLMGRAWITAIPEGLRVGGGLNLRETGLLALPEGFRVGGHLELDQTPLTALPKGLVVGGTLTARYVPLTELPPDLRVGGSLNLIGARVATYPPGLAVGKRIYLCYGRIASLPDGLRVEEDLDLEDNPIRTLPVDLHVGGDLLLNRTAVGVLPSGLVVGGDLVLRDCPDWDGRIPKGTRIGGVIRSDRCQDGMGLKTFRRLFPQGEPRP